MSDSTVSQDLAKSIGNRIKQLRKNKKEIQETLADFLNISKSALSKIEQGNYRLQIEEAVKIANKYGVSLDYLINGHTESNGAEEILEILCKYFAFDYFSNRHYNPDKKHTRQIPCLAICKVFFDFLNESKKAKDFSINNANLSEIPDELIKIWEENIKNTALKSINGVSDSFFAFNADSDFYKFYLLPFPPSNEPFPESIADYLEKML